MLAYLRSKGWQLYRTQRLGSFSIRCGLLWFITISIFTVDFPNGLCSSHREDRPDPLASGELVHPSALLKGEAAFCFV